VSTLVFDASPLSHFARAGFLQQLEALTKGDSCYVTDAVLDEVRRGAGTHPELQKIPDLPWLTTVRLAGLAELALFAQYARLLGSGPRDVGEATVLAWAESKGAVAIVDEQAARRAGRQRGVTVHGSLWLIARGLRGGTLTDREASSLVDALRATNARFPCAGHDFLAWAREHGLL